MSLFAWTADSMMIEAGLGQLGALGFHVPL